MSIIEKRPKSADRVIAILDEYAGSQRDYIFRGQSNVAHSLSTSLQRFRSRPHEDWCSDIDNMLEAFRSGLAKLGHEAINTNKRLDWMEYARHHGVPTPCIDFSYSPYVALFFSINGCKEIHEGKTTYSVVYAINIEQLAGMWAERMKKTGTEKDCDYYRKQFLSPDDDIFEYGFPANVLQFIPLAGRFNNRMQRQFGSLLYDTIDYSQLNKVKNLEELIRQYKEPEVRNGTKIEPGIPIFTKIYVNRKFIGRIFSRLELMGITGCTLYMDANGVALDIVNLYNYNAKTNIIRGLEFSPIDEDKLYDIF